MVGLGKPQLHAKFEVASFSHYRNIIGEPQNFRALASAVAEILKNPKFWGTPLAQGHTHFFSWKNLIMGLGKLHQHAKFEVAGFIRYGIIREFVFKQQICFSIHPLEEIGVTKDFIYSSYGWCTNTSKSALLKGVGHFGATFTTNIYTPLDSGMVLLQFCHLVFTQRNFVAEFILFKLIFTHENDKFTLWATLWGTWGQRTHFIAYWKAHSRLPICDNWTSFLLALIVKTL